ncbi:MAG TPA: ATP-binding protein, partial [Thermoanaerobaculia bacterium]|nr:ATP-binding protein [Thermoanaerobaculia bacterium]
MSFRARVLLAIFGNAVIAVAIAYVSKSPFVALFLTLPFVFWSAGRLVSYVEWSLTSLDDGLRAFKDGDFSMRLASGSDDRTMQIKRLYNEVADVLRVQRNDVYQKELLLDTILQRTPVAVVLVTESDRVLYSNTAARELFAARLDGRLFSELLPALLTPMREAIAAGGDAIVTVPGGDRDETFHLTQRTFHLNTVAHRLVLVERLTAELRRQEVTVWKNAIRVINHELNNTIAPISSLIHSARIAQERPDRRHHLPEIYGTIEERLAFLRTFLESYAQFARLPQPRRERTQWREILDDVAALYEFRVDGSPHEEASIDRAQMQQVVINLVKNAHESGSPPDDIVVSVQRAVEGTVLRVVDRGRGMSEDVIRQALVPFYTTKPAGSGLGLPLCNEILEAHGGRMRLQG